MITLPQSTPVSTHMTKHLYDCLRYVCWLIKINLKFLLSANSNTLLWSLIWRPRNLASLGYSWLSFLTTIDPLVSFPFWTNFVLESKMYIWHFHADKWDLSGNSTVPSADVQLTASSSHYLKLFSPFITHLSSRQSVHIFIAVIVTCNTGEFLRNCNMQNPILFEHLLLSCLLTKMTWKSIYTRRCCVNLVIYLMRNSVLVQLSPGRHCW